MFLKDIISSKKTDGNVPPLDDTTEDGVVLLHTAKRK
jgi:hypothetical protein